MRTSVKVMLQCTAAVGFTFEDQEIQVWPTTCVATCASDGTNTHGMRGPNVEENARCCVSF